MVKVKSTNVRRPYQGGELHDLLCLHFPQHRTPNLVFDVPRIARDLGFVNETIYRCLRKDWISVEVSKKLIALSEDLQLDDIFEEDRYPEKPLAPVDLLAFLFNEY
ncbi:hypothetical protein P1J78_22125 [Psychromarinibacter sp. C21-152]|uniref:Uncharacterized protein n=1 Tax=Psychromarinibacter sediminicola TaxID=3033385 RepID=A0AAE3NTV2_9RHOB|nr:hypothetical protein [Psychromarinibacter sediminicola]MDF0603433.1 hypothetical protein [Psychromarinibacter sediminicola]